MLAFMRDSVRPDLSFLPDNIHLVAIHPDTRAISARWFGSDRASAEAWAADRNVDGHNVYWTVNEVRAGLHAKPSKADIVRVRFAHVDVDPPKDGRPLDGDAVRAGCSRYQPSIEIHSGNGIQLLWGISGSASPDEIEALNRGIAHKLAGDDCWNVDRLLRVPGTVNLPDARKRALGRTAVLATLASADRAAVKLAVSVLGREFPPLPPRQRDVEEPEVGPFDPIPWQELRPPPSDLLRARITAEQVPGQRSEQVMRAATMMLHEGYSREEVAGVLYCADNPISAHIFDKDDPERAARRAAARALAPDRSDTFGEAPSASRSRGRLWSVPELMAQPRPPELIRGVLPAVGVGFLGGQSGALKTFLAIELAVCLSSRRPFAARLVSRVGAVVIVPFEGEATLADRFRAHADAQPDKLPVRVLSGFGPVATDADFRDFHSALSDAAATLQIPMSAVIIDTVAAAGMIGEDKENDPAAWQRVFDRLRPISSELNAPIILVHHYGKAAEAGLRGSSNARAGADFVLAMTCERDELTGESKSHRLVVTKNRSGREGIVANVSASEVEVGKWDDGCPVTTLRLRFEAPSAAPKPKTLAVRMLEEAFEDVSADGIMADKDEVRAAFDRRYAASGNSQSPETLKRQFNKALGNPSSGLYIHELQIRRGGNGGNGWERTLSFPGAAAQDGDGS